MSDPAVNCTLEISCTVGSLDNALDALDEGADINCRSGAPLFNAIYNRNVEIIRMLIEKGADLSLFLPAGQLKPLGEDIDKIVDALMAGAPPDPDAIELDAMEEFDEEIRAKGLETPVKNGDWDGLVRYAGKLEKIEAVNALKSVNELIELLKPAQEFGDAALFETVKAEKKSIAALSDRYREEAEDIGNLTQFYISSQAGGAVIAPSKDPAGAETVEESSPFNPPVKAADDSSVEPSETSEGEPAASPESPPLQTRPATSSFSPAT